MDDQKPQSRPEPPAAPGPAKRAIYGGQWGSGGKPGDADKGHVDRPEPIDVPRESAGAPDPGPEPGTS